MLSDAWGEWGDMGGARGPAPRHQGGHNMANAAPGIDGGGTTAVADARSRVPLGTKLAYSSGRVAEAVKIRAFETFLFFYYVQVLELAGSLSGLAVGIALIFDAVTDPVLGSLSDNWHSRWGRRHPFMLASVVPLPIVFCLLFMPPAGFGQLGLFLWLTTFAVLTRGAVTLFHVPHLSLGAELSQDYLERTQIVALRSFGAIVGSSGTAMLGFFYYFRATEEFKNGQMNATAYPPFAVACAVVMVVTILYCVWGTRKSIPHLPRPPREVERFGPTRVLKETWLALQNASFRNVFIALILMAVTTGAHSTLLLHIGTFFWALTPTQIAYYIFALTGGAIGGVVLAGRLHRRLDKKASWLACVTVSVAFSTGTIALRLVGWFPENGDPLMLPILLVCSGIGVMGALASGITVGSMMADIADAHDLETGKRQEGIFFGALSLSGKAASALGHLVAGVALQLIRWPQGAEVKPEDVDPTTMWWLGFVYGPFLWIFAIASVYIFNRYSLTRAGHAQIRAAIDARDAAEEP